MNRYALEVVDVERGFEVQQFFPKKLGSGLNVFCSDQFEARRQDSKGHVAAFKDDHVAVAQRSAVGDVKFRRRQIGKLKKLLAIDQPAFEASIRILKLLGQS